MTDDLYRVKHSPIYHSDGSHEVGEIIEPSDAVLEAFGDNLEKTETDAESEDASADSESSDEEGNGDEDAADTNSKVEAEAESGEESAAILDNYDEFSVDDVKEWATEDGRTSDEIEAAIEYEKENKNRSTALDALDEERSK
jgi:uncharacterized protein (DUF433 family)